MIDCCHCGENAKDPDNLNGVDTEVTELAEDIAPDDSDIYYCKNCKTGIIMFKDDLVVN